jgi:hypothetical protein
MGKFPNNTEWGKKNCTVVLINQAGRIQLIAPLEQIDSAEASAMLSRIDQLIKQ